MNFKSTAATAPKTLGRLDGKLGFLGSIGVRFMIWGEEAGEHFAMVEHPMSPRALAAPMHRHSREDEYSYVLRGRLGALLGDDVVFAEPGELVFKPRNQWHTFWNAGDEPASILEIIAPAGFERFFSELSDQGGVTNVQPAVLRTLCEHYGVEMKPETVPDLLQRFQLRFPGEPVPLNAAP
jgi:quercetin dioxygenase-like cupin family protein